MDDEPLEFNVKNSPQAQATPHKDREPYLAEVKEDEVLLSGGDYYAREYDVKYPVLLIIFMVIGGISVLWKTLVSPDTSSVEVRQKIMQQKYEENKDIIEYMRKAGVSLPEELLKLQETSPQDTDSLKSAENEKKRQE